MNTVIHFGNEVAIKIENSYKCFDEIPFELYDEALKTLNKQFHAFRAGHIRAVELGRGSQLQGINVYIQTKKIAIHEAGHVMAVWYGGSRNSVSYAMILQHWMNYHNPYGHITPVRKYPLETQADLFEELCFHLSGRIAESMFFPEDSPHFPYFLNYKRSDIHKAINIAYYMTRTDYGAKVASTSFSTDFLEDVSCYLIRGYEATTDLLKSRSKLLQKLALELLEVKILQLGGLLKCIGPPRKRLMSLYDQYCAFSMELRPLAKKRYCLNRKRSKKTKNRKGKARCSSKRKKSKAPMKHSKKNRGSAMSNRKGQRTSKSTRKRKQRQPIAPKKRLTNDGQVISVFN